MCLTEVTTHSCTHIIDAAALRCRASSMLQMSQLEMVLCLHGESIPVIHRKGVCVCYISCLLTLQALSDNMRHEG